MCLNCPDCKFNKNGNCYKYGFQGTISCKDNGCKYKFSEPYNYPKKTLNINDLKYISTKI